MIEIALARPRMRALVAAGSGLAFTGLVAVLGFQPTPARSALEIVADIPGVYPVEILDAALPSVAADRTVNVADRVSVAALVDDFKARGYTTLRVRAADDSVPRVILAQLPHDIHAVDSIDQRKEVFIATLLPILLAENERIAHRRVILEDLVRTAESGEPLSENDRNWLARLARDYKVDPGDFDELLLRVDVVPPSLAIAQAALESGWGTSRVARTAQALFGHTTGVWREGSDYPDLRRFATLSEAVAAYVENLNTNRAYARLRAARAAMRRNGGEIDTNTLVAHLVRYSERGADYVRDVRALMRANDLRALDNARFID